jgi:hypothetical protein
MPHLRVMFDNQEIDRRDLDAPVVIGRCSQCQLPVRDILLSRSHCRIEPAGGGSWQAVDLASKNGTTLNGEALTAAAPLADGDILRLGRVKICFAAGTLAEIGLTPLSAPKLRPSDPTESMTGTYVGFAFLEPGESAETHSAVPSGRNAPRPNPAPPAPAAFAREDIYSLLSSIASSSWDSIYAEARRPLPAGSAAALDQMSASRPRVRPRSPIDFSLQVCQRTEFPASPARPRRPISPRRLRPRRLISGGAVWLMLLAVVVFKCWFDAGSPLSALPLAASAAQPPQVQTITPAELFSRAAAGLLPAFF